MGNHIEFELLLDTVCNKIVNDLAPYKEEIKNIERNWGSSRKVGHAAQRG